MGKLSSEKPALTGAWQPGVVVRVQRLGEFCPPLGPYSWIEHRGEIVVGSRELYEKVREASQPVAGA